MHMNPETPVAALPSAHEDTVIRREFNAYPFLRRVFFALIVLFFVILILFLVYQNGKSIYDGGI